MKKLAVLFLFAAALTSCATLGKTSGYFFYAEKNGTITITGCNYSFDYPENLIIPDTINGLPVTAIGTGAFLIGPGITRLTIPGSVTLIGRWAFSNCGRLETVIMPPNTEYYGNTFSDRVRFYADVDSAPALPAVFGTSGYFEYEEKNGKIAITGIKMKYEKSLSDFVFDLPEHLTIPAAINGLPVTVIGHDVFYRASNYRLTPGITSLTIPGSVTRIGRRAFSPCEKLETVTMSPDTEYYMFSFPENVRIIYAVSAPSQPKPAAPKTPFTGDGGKGKSITIIAPRAAGLAAGQNYIPALVQGEFISVFSAYSAINVFNRQQLDEQYAELLSGYYNDSAGGDLGHLPPTEYFMSGTITKTTAGYSLQMTIARNADKMVAATYSGNCTFAELDNLTAVRKASSELLGKMDVSLTAAAKQELSGPASPQAVNAETALARGVTAQRNGTVVEALSYYYEAANFDPGLVEAANRRSAITANMTGGTIGQNVRNDIQQRAAWLKTLNEAAAFFQEHPPFEIVYNSRLARGGIDYAKETVDIGFDIHLIGTSGFMVIGDLLGALKRTGKSWDWGFINGRWKWPLSGEAAVFTNRIKRYDIIVTLLNANGKPIGAVQGTLRADYGIDEYFFPRDVVKGRPGEFAAGNLIFRDVKAADITDNLTLSIVSVNGIDAKTAGGKGYIRLSPRYIPSDPNAILDYLPL